MIFGLTALVTLDWGYEVKACEIDKPGRLNLVSKTLFWQGSCNHRPLIEKRLMLRYLLKQNGERRSRSPVSNVLCCDSSGAWIRTKDLRVMSSCPKTYMLEGKTCPVS